VDGIQNGLLIKVRTALIEEALMTTVIRDGEPMDEEKHIMIPEHEPEPPAPEVEYACCEGAHARRVVLAGDYQSRLKH
jgi:hypothetical protein